MIPSIDNAIQIAVTLGCSIIALKHALTVRERAWFLLTLFYFTFFLGDVYYQLFIMFYGEFLNVSFISDFAWYTSYLFLLLLLIYMNTEDNKNWKYRFRPSFMPIPVFTIGMCIFYMYSWGDYLSNVIAATLMMGLIWHACYGLYALRGQPEQEGKDRRMLCKATLLFCAAEYTLWTSSCFWMGETIYNIYYWADVLLSFSFVLFLPALRKAVGR